MHHAAGGNDDQNVGEEGGQRPCRRGGRWDGHVRNLPPPVPALGRHRRGSRGDAPGRRIRRQPQLRHHAGSDDRGAAGRGLALARADGLPARWPLQLRLARPPLRLPRRPERGDGPHRVPAPAGRRHDSHRPRPELAGARGRPRPRARPRAGAGEDHLVVRAPAARRGRDEARDPRALRPARDGAGAADDDAGRSGGARHDARHADRHQAAGRSPRSVPGAFRSRDRRRWIIARFRPSDEGDSTHEDLARRRFCRSGARPRASPRGASRGE